ncbi:hypothetical protein EON65_05810 [archaeon]|nr:MAG: hypothetical protein EON65_05810 [archaeon]
MTRKKSAALQKATKALLKLFQENPSHTPLDKGRQLSLLTSNYVANANILYIIVVKELRDKDPESFELLTSQALQIVSSLDEFDAVLESLKNASAAQESNIPSIFSSCCLLIKAQLISSDGYAGLLSEEVIQRVLLMSQVLCTGMTTEDDEGANSPPKRPRSSASKKSITPWVRYLHIVLHSVFVFMTNFPI